jgi:Fe-S-cluster containining protein
MAANTRQDILQQLYRLYDEYVSGLQTACRIGCAACCTRNVILTSLEADGIRSLLQSNHRLDLLTKIEAGTALPRFQPKVTVNGLADLCARGIDPPAEEVDPDPGVCPLLENDVCPAYEVRPFECRSLISLSDCRLSGYADMPETTVSINNLFRQFIEALDVDGTTGNLTDLLSAVDGPAKKALPNRSIPVLMIDPCHRSVVEPILAALQQLIR